MRAVIMIALAACGGGGGGDTPDAFVVDADPSAPDAMPREIVMETHTLMPGELVEGIMTGGPAESAQIQLSAPTPTIGWNIHGHAAGGTQVAHEEFDQMTVSYPFTPPAESKWYLLVRNDGGVTTDVVIKVQLFGDLAWEWQ
ncbi:MAG: hypothetical protein WKG01_24435 [Kofleriaceae bacterium]